MGKELLWNKEKEQNGEGKDRGKEGIRGERTKRVVDRRGKRGNLSVGKKEKKTMYE